MKSNKTKLRYDTSVVCLSGVDERFPCLLNVEPETWNGYECPRFTKENAERIVIALRSATVDCRAVYDAKSDEFRFTMGDDKSPSTFGCVDVVDGVKYYAIGAGAWCWEEVTRPADISTYWPAYIAATHDLLHLIKALQVEQRLFHFDDDPAELPLRGGSEKLFSSEESEFLNTLIHVDCANLGGVWKMVENEKGQHCARALDLTQVEPKPARKKRDPVRPYLMWASFTAKRGPIVCSTQSAAQQYREGQRDKVVPVAVIPMGDWLESLPLYKRAVLADIGVLHKPSKKGASA